MSGEIDGVVRAVMREVMDEERGEEKGEARGRETLLYLRLPPAFGQEETSYLNGRYWQRA